MNEVERKTMAGLWQRRAAGLAAFEAWERTNLPERPAAAVLADIGALYELLPADARHRDEDPERRGIRRMHAALAVLGRGRAR